MIRSQGSVPRGKLIIVWGLPGTGKTSHAQKIEKDSGAVRFCPDEWMAMLGINLWDSEARERIEKLQWEIAQQLLLGRLQSNH